MHEGIPILDYRVPKAFVHENGKLTGMTFEKVRAEYDAKGRRKLVPTGEPDEFHACDDVLIAVGQENAFPWIERDIGIEFDEWGMPVVDKVTLQSTHAARVLRRRRRVRPEEHHLGGRARPRRRHLDRQDCSRRGRPATGRRRCVTSCSQKMGIHEWSYDNEISPDERRKVPWAPAERTLKNIKVEVELGFDVATALKETQRCLNCDVQTVFAPQACIECDACVDICPMDCITFTANGEEARPAPAPHGAGAEPHAGPVRVAGSSRPAASWSRTRTSACTAACAPSAARPAPGTCRSSCSTRRRPARAAAEAPRREAA